MTLINENWKPNFYKYEKVRRSGRYNMIMEADKAVKACDISSREYRDILLNYNHYKGYIEAKYESVDKFMRKYKKCGYQITSVKLLFGMTLAQRNVLERKQLGILTRGARAEWKNDKIYGTELSMVLNHKCWYWYEKQNEELSKLYAKLWEEYHGWVLENWRGEDLGYYLRVMD